MTEQTRRQIAKSFTTLSLPALHGIAAMFKAGGDTELNDMAEAELVRRFGDRICQACGAVKPVGQSCCCFDNGCQ